MTSLTEAPAGTWVPVPGRLGTHDRFAIEAATVSLQSEGFLELDAGLMRLRP